MGEIIEQTLVEGEGTSSIKICVRAVLLIAKQQDKQSKHLAPNITPGVHQVTAQESRGRDRMQSLWCLPLLRKNDDKTARAGNRVYLFESHHLRCQLLRTPRRYTTRCIGTATTLTNDRNTLFCSTKMEMNA